MRWSVLGIDLGSRISLSSLSGSKKLKVFEPRLNITLKPGSFIALKGAIGLYQQELLIVTEENEVINLYELWLIIPSYLNPSIAIHYISGINIMFADNFNFGIERL